MPENTEKPSDKLSEPDNDDTPLHTCACGEQHRPEPGSGSHRDECTSPKKFGDSCCCGSGPAARAHQHRCGHGPRC